MTTPLVPELSILLLSAMDKTVFKAERTPGPLADPVSRLLTFRLDGGKRRIIGLAGYPGSGKSTISAEWAETVKEARGNDYLTVLGMDGFHLYRDELSRMEDPETAFARRGAPYTFAPEQFIEKLKELREAASKRTVGWPGFEHEAGDPVPDALKVPAACPLVLVEGIYVLYREGPWKALEGMFDETWFLDTPLETAMNRLYIRHRKAWGLSEKEARTRADGNDRLNCAYISPGRETADWLVSPS